MYLAPDGDEIQIADAAAKFLADVMPISRLHRPNAADLNAPLRKQIAAMGWFAMAVPEESGGSALSAVKQALFFREAGRQCAPVDLLSQCLAASLVSDAGLRRSIVSGDAAVTLLVPDGKGWRLVGAADAEHGLHVTREVARLRPLPHSVAEHRPSLDPANSIRISTSDSDPVAEGQGERIWRLGQLSTASMLVGIAEAALDMIVEYAKTRETFGRKIGAWQAVRHPCADMAVRAEAARSQLFYAAAALDEDRKDASAHLDAAKHLANQAAHANADANIQLHGGIGVTDEHNAHLLLKHSLLLSRLFGSKRNVLEHLLHAKLVD
jgi:alkylation response protein AidB-like acyl-CoA dehydrogenase